MPIPVMILNPARKSKKRIRGNPHLVIVNGKKRRKNMATAKQKKARALFAKRAKSGAFKRTNKRRKAASVRTNRKGGFFRLNKKRATSRRPKAGTHTNMRPRHHTVRRINRRHPRRNPGVLGIFEGATVAILGMAITDFVQNTLVASFLPDLSGTPVMRGGVRLLLALGVGMGAEKFGFGRFANLLAIGGAVGGAQDVLRGFIGGGGLLFPAQQQQPQLRQGQAMIPADMTGEGAGTGDIVYVDPNFDALGDIVYTNLPPGWFQ